MTKPSESQEISTEPSQPQTGSSDPVKNALKRKGIPVSRPTYLKEAGITEPVSPEVEAQLPPDISQYANQYPAGALSDVTPPRQVTKHRGNVRKKKEVNASVPKP